MSTIDPNVTPVWALCSDGCHAEIVNAPLRDPRINVRALGGKWTSTSGWCETREELIAKNGILMGCKSCGNPFASKGWCKPIPQELIGRHLCFHCNHYIHTIIPKRDSPGTCIVGHVFYSFDHTRPVVPHTPWLGHAGRTFGIQFNDGRLVTTNNLWCGGDIPEIFREALPDNARFI